MHSTILALCLSILLLFTANAVQAVTVEQAFASHKSDVQVKSVGIVTRVLIDENDGSRHQKFILIAHNIDLAPRIDGIGKGDTVEFYGEYEWSSKGGVLHWTHHDPQNRHVPGWLKHKGRVYQ